MYNIAFYLHFYNLLLFTESLRANIMFNCFIDNTIKSAEYVFCLFGYGNIEIILIRKCKRLRIFPEWDIPRYCSEIMRNTLTAFNINTFLGQDLNSVIAFTLIYRLSFEYFLLNLSSLLITLQYARHTGAAIVWETFRCVINNSKPN